MNKVPEDFKPPQRIYELAQKEGIPAEFVDSLINDFIFYWSERKVRRKNWNITFWNRVKQKWSWEKEKERSTRGTMPQSNVMWEGEKVEKAKSRPSLAELKSLL